MNKLPILISFAFVLTATLWGQSSNPYSFIPKGYVIFDAAGGDLNKDGIADSVFIIKGTDKDNFVYNHFDSIVDRNRRGIIVLFKKNGLYELAVRNIECFSSENEDGGAYYAPELFVEIRKGNLYIQYAHGRYGYWRYTLRYRNSEFELIGYDRRNGGAVIDSDESINFLTRKKRTIVNTNKNAEGGDEIFKTIWSKIKIQQLVRLSEIEDFDELDMDIY